MLLLMTRRHHRSRSNTSEQRFHDLGARGTSVSEPIEVVPELRPASSDLSEIQPESLIPDINQHSWVKRTWNKILYYTDLKKAQRSDYIALWKDFYRLEIDVSQLTAHKRNQLKRLVYLTQLNRAYSIYYYEWARFWKIVYWSSNISSILLTGTNTIANIVFSLSQTQNIIWSAVLTSVITIIAFLDASWRRRQYEEAGDEYRILALELYRTSFFPENGNWDEADLGEILDEFSIKMGAWAKVYEEPPPKTIELILSDVAFDMPISFI